MQKIEKIDKIIKHIEISKEENIYNEIDKLITISVNQKNIIKNFTINQLNALKNTTFTNDIEIVIDHKLNTIISQILNNDKKYISKIKIENSTIYEYNLRYDIYMNEFDNKTFATLLDKKYIADKIEWINTPKNKKIIIEKEKFENLKNILKNTINIKLSSQKEIIIK